MIASSWKLQVVDVLGIVTDSGPKLLPAGSPQDGPGAPQES